MTERVDRLSELVQRLMLNDESHSLSSLSPQAKHRVGRLILQVAEERKSAEFVKTELEKERSDRIVKEAQVSELHKDRAYLSAKAEQLNEETQTLRTKFKQSLAVLNKFKREVTKQVEKQKEEESQRRRLCGLTEAQRGLLRRYIHLQTDDDSNSFDESSSPSPKGTIKLDSSHDAPPPLKVDTSTTTQRKLQTSTTAAHFEIKPEITTVPTQQELHATTSELPRKSFVRSRPSLDGYDSPPEVYSSVQIASPISMSSKMLDDDRESEVTLVDLLNDSRCSLSSPARIKNTAIAPKSPFGARYRLSQDEDRALFESIELSLRLNRKPPCRPSAPRDT